MSKDHVIHAPRRCPLHYICSSDSFKEQRGIQSRRGGKGRGENWNMSPTRTLDDVSQETIGQYLLHGRNTEHLP
jgi:hypothetical protein